VPDDPEEDAVVELQAMDKVVTATAERRNLYCMIGREQWAATCEHPLPPPGGESYQQLRWARTETDQV
jgi:hypothetical protein